jgi:hypothetical protein
MTMKIIRFYASTCICMVGRIKPCCASTRVVRQMVAAAALFTSVVLPIYAISADYTRIAAVTDTQPPVHTHDLAVVSIKAPKKVTLSSKKPAVVTTVKVAIQNRSPYVETIQDLSTLTKLVSLNVAPETTGSNCAAPVPVLHAGKPQPVLPVVLKPNKTLKLVFDVTFACAVDPMKGSGHEDFHYIAQVDASALDGQEDMIPASDVCPRSPIPVIDGSKPDKGCGGKLPGKVLGGSVLSDVVLKSGSNGGGPSTVEPLTYAEPALVADVISVIAVATGWAHSCAVDETGQAWCWGVNEYGQLGCTADIGSVPIGDTPYIDTPCAVETVTPSTGFTSIASSMVVTCGLDLSGSAICWGYGIPLDPSRAPIGPTAVDTTERFTLLRAAMGDSGMCGINAIGTRYCWGPGETTAERLVPHLQDDSGLQFVDIALSQGWGCGVTGDGEAWCWGSNWFGQLGVGTVGQFEGPVTSPVPVKVMGDRSYVSIVAGLMHTCALDTEGAAWCWGSIPVDNAYGIPQPVPGDHRFDKLFAGGQFTCGLTNSGQAWCWGSGPFGELGNGSYGDSLEPLQVAGGLYFSTLALGGTHVCGITTDQRLYCWGSNEFGQVGRPL